MTLSALSTASSFSTITPNSEIPPSPAEFVENTTPSHTLICKLAQKALLLNDVDTFENELLEKYEEKVVRHIFTEFKKLGRKVLSEDDKHRLDIWCHYFDVDFSFRKKIYKIQSPESRLLRHLLKYSQREVFQRISYASHQPCLSHEEINRCAKNIELFITYEKELIETFEESLCHQSLTRISLFPSEVLLGIDPMMDLETIKSSIYNYYQQEIHLRAKIESASHEELLAQSEDLKQELTTLKNVQVAQELFMKLAIKSGRVDWLRSVFPTSVIERQAKLFEASRLAEEWANAQEELKPIPGSGFEANSQGPGNQNMVYFLKNPHAEASSPPIAVFKGSKIPGAMETLVYDAAVIFGLQNAFVPTKLKKFKDKSGSVQLFQKGLSWSQFLALAPKKPKPVHLEALSAPPIEQPLHIQKATTSAPAVLETIEKTSTEPVTETKEVNLQNEIINRISMEDFLKAGFAALLFGNRDLHVGNFFFVQKEDGNYSIVVFDNEESFYQSNYILVNHRGDCLLPIRNSLLIFPHADTPITGELKEHVRKFINSFEKRFEEFMAYMSSPSGKHTLKDLPRKKLSYNQLKAFKTRVEKLIRMANSSRDHTYRDYVYSLFPLYESFLTLTKFLYPDQPEMMVGYHPAQELCDEVIKMGYMTEEKKQAFIEDIKKYQYKC